MKWPEYNLDAIAEIVMGQSPPSLTYNEVGNGLPFFQGKAEFGYTYPSIRKWCTEPSRTAKKGDILMSVRAPVGPTNIAPCDCCIGRGLAAIRAKNGIVEQQFLWFLFKYIEPFLSRQGQGSTFAAISRSDISSLKVLLPSLSEQKYLIKILDQADQLRKRRAEADGKAARILPALFYKMFGDPATNPKGLKRTTIAEAGCEVRYGLGQPPSIVSAAEGKPFIRATNIDHGEISGKDMLYVHPRDIPTGRNAVLKSEEIIVVRSGAYTGDVAQVTEEWTGSIAGYDLIITPGADMLGEFIEAYLLTGYIQKNYFANLKSRAGQPHLNSSQVSATPLLNPPIELQIIFAENVRQQRQDTKHRRSIKQKIERLFIILLHRAFTGDLTTKWREAHMKELIGEMEQQAKYLSAAASA